MIPANNLYDFPVPDEDEWIKRFHSELKTNKLELDSWQIEEDLFSVPYQSTTKIDPKQLVFNQNSQKIIKRCFNITTVANCAKYDINHTSFAFAKNGIDGVLCEINDFEDIAFLLKTEIQNIFLLAKIKDSVILQKLLSSSHLLKGGIATDPILNWMQNKIAYQDYLNTIATHLRKKTTNDAPFVLMIDSSSFHNSGAGIVLETALLLSATVNYIDLLSEKGVTAEDAMNSMFYSVAVGTTYVPEIAKLRAIRILLKQIGLSYTIPFEKITPFIHVTNSNLVHAKIEENNNILRYTTAAMSALIGGCDALTIIPHTETEPNQEAEKLARNCVNILLNETQIDKVSDPLAGAYAIEQLTESIRIKAWQLFLDIESKGGIIAYHNSGKLKEALDKSWLEKLKALDIGVMVGVNKYRTDPRPTHLKTKSIHAYYPARNYADNYVGNIKQ